MAALGYLPTPDITKYPIFYGSSLPESTVPESYRLKDIGEVLDQGNKGSCVSCSIFEMYSFYCLSHGKQVDIDYEYLYDRRKDKSLDGMSPGEGFEILREEGKIEVFSRIPNIEYLKQAVIANGPAMIAMIVRDQGRLDFWNGSETQPIGHAVAVVGYTDDGEIIIKNSWGYSYGESGLWYLPGNEFNSVVREAWTIIS